VFVVYNNIEGEMAKIISSKNVLGGRQRIAGTRISVDLVYNYFRDDNIKQIYVDYPHLKKDQVESALDYLDKKLHSAKEQVDPAPA